MDLHIDFETFSREDLTKCGLYRYAMAKSTGVHCMAFAFSQLSVSAGVGLLTPSHRLPDDIREHVESGGTIVAHNAQFEFMLWNSVCVPRYGWPKLSIGQMRCTMAQAYAMALPGSLENLAVALGVDMQKDLSGKRIMLKLCKPRPVREGDFFHETEFYTQSEAPKDFETLYEYCKQDVRTEMACDAKLLKLSKTEQAIWQLDQQINMRGIPIDMPTVHKALEVIDSEGQRLSRLMRDVTQGFVGTASSSKALVDWCALQDVTLDSAAKGDITDLLDCDDLPGNVRQALLIRQEAAKSSTAKLKAMANKAGDDNRVRFELQYHGASTGRWAGRAIQVQNFPRPRKLAKGDAANEACINEIISLMTVGDYESIDMLYGPKLAAISDGLRGMICATKGHDLISADYANIEGRVLAWLAGEEWKLDAFRAYDNGEGPDLYLVAAARIYNVPVAEATPHRQIGKVSELALGFGGGQGAFQSMASVYGVKVGIAEAEDIKTRWRDAHPETVAFWRALENAALNAVRHPGQIFSAGAEGRQCAFRMKGNFLFCQLPSLRLLSYPSPRIEKSVTPWGKEVDKLTFMSVNDKNQWVRTDTYGGSLAENVTQAVARDLLANAIISLHTHKYLPIFHVHDEIICEVPEGFGNLAEYESIMCDLPAWADGLPVTAEGYRAKRFKK